LWPLGTVVRTNGDGRFLFHGVPEGKYTLIVIHDRIKATVEITMLGRQYIEGVLMVVNPAPAITGSVFDASGQRLASARVDAFRMTYRPSGAHLALLKSVMTDDLGSFRLFRIPPGAYYVSASYSERDQKSGGAAIRWSPNVSNADDGFPTVYVGGGYNATQSQRIDLGQGDMSGSNIYYREGPRYSVSGRLVGLDGDVCARIAIVPEGGVVDPEKDFLVNACGRFTVKGLSPGVHFLFAAGKGFASDAIRINVPERNVENLTVTMERTVAIRGRVTMSDAPVSAAPTRGGGARGQALGQGRGRGGIPAPSGQASARRVVLWRSSNEITQKIEQAVDQDGTFEIPEVGPGFFDVFVEPLTDGLYVASIRQGIQDLLQRPTELTKNARNNFGDLNIQLSGRSAIAEGVALDRAGRPVPGTQVVLVPTVLRNREDRYYSVYTDPGGNFRITGIAPGTYIVFAFEDLDQGAYFAMTYDDGIGNRWLPRGNKMDFAEPAVDPLKALTGVPFFPATETPGGVLR
jgi:hypothetical protein